MELPTITDAYDSLSRKEFQEIETNYLNDQSPQSTFNYAWALLKQPTKQDQRKAHSLFQIIYKESPKRRTEMLYYLALLNYKLNELDQAKSYLNTLLQMDGGNKHAIVLLDQVNEQIKNGI
jgi:fission 1 protein